MRNRLHYPNLAIAVGNGHGFTDTAGDLKNLDRVQGISFEIDANRTKAGEVGSFGLVANQVLQAPDVNLSVEYLLSDGENEKRLGFYVNSGAGWKGLFSDMTLNNLKRKDDSLDFIVVGAEEGEDANFKSDFDGDDVIGFGNCYLRGYNLSMDVDSFPKVQLDLVASNMSFQTFDINKTLDLPSVNSYLGKPRTEDDDHASNGKFSSASLNPEMIKPFRHGVSVPTFGRGDVRIEVFEDLGEDEEKSIGGNLLFSFEKSAVQSLDLSMQMERKDIRGFGRNYVGDRKIRYPVMSTLDVDLLVRELEVGNLKSILTHDKTYNVSIKFFYPKSLGITNIYDGDDVWGYEKGPIACDDKKGLVLGILYKGAKLTSHSFNLGIGDNMESNMSFEVDTTPNAKPFRGVYMYDADLFLRDEIAWSLNHEGEKVFV
jgi:hypothetical protein|tara:strand:- start:766 stop:2052 length:1287 start_codon:yes stop_codon:yes gene_type:complete